MRTRLLSLVLLQPLNFCGWIETASLFQRRATQKFVPACYFSSGAPHPMPCLSHLPLEPSPQSSPASPPTRLSLPLTLILASPFEKRHRVTLLFYQPILLCSGCLKHGLHCVRLCFSFGTHSLGTCPLCLRFQLKLPQSSFTHHAPFALLNSGEPLSVLTAMQWETSKSHSRV